MSANVEFMYSASNVTPWHNLGIVISEALTSEEAIKTAKLDWDVIPNPIYDGFGRELSGYKVNLRSTDNKILGIVSDKYKIVQNRDAFAFTDSLLGQGVKYETAGSLASGKRVWMLARLENTILAEENIDPYLVFTNSHDGTGAVKVAITPVRTVCENTLNLALKTASRHWSARHMGQIEDKLEDAKMTLLNAETYMKCLGEEFEALKLKKVTDSQVKEMTDYLLKEEFETVWKNAYGNDTNGKIVSFLDRARAAKYEEKIDRKRNEILTIYNDKPDLRDEERTAFRFVNAVSDYATHTTDHKNTANYQENLFMKTVDGNNLIDTAYKIALAV